MSFKPITKNSTRHKQVDLTKVERLNELAEFLKSCRDRTNPETLNLPARPRRRSPGLSRTEVAALASISVDWYTWLEQGRDIHPSIQVIEKLAEVFRLTQPERRYLHTLTALLPEPAKKLYANTEIVQRMISYMPEAAAFVLRKDWQILAQNEPAKKLFGSWSRLDEKDRNILYLFFTDKVFTEYLRNWEWHAKIAIRQFRAIYGTEIGNPIFVSLIKRLSKVSPQFKLWWAEADVTGRDDGHKEFDHPVLGYQDYDYTILRPAENQTIEVVVFIPRVDQNRS